MELIAAHTATVEQWMQRCKLSCFSPLAFPQDPAVGRVCREDTGESLVLEQAGHRCRGVFPACRCLGRGTRGHKKHSVKDLKPWRAAAVLVYSTKRIIALS